MLFIVRLRRPRESSRRERDMKGNVGTSGILRLLATIVTTLSMAWIVSSTGQAIAAGTKGNALSRSLQRKGFAFAKHSRAGRLRGRLHNDLVHFLPIAAQGVSSFLYTLC